MLDVRAAAAKSLARVISSGESFSGNMDEFHLHIQTSENNQSTKKLATTKIDKRDTALYRELCFGTLRHFFILNAIVKSFLKKPLAKKDTDIHALLLIGLYQIIYLRTPDHASLNSTVSATKSIKKPWAKGLVNAVLRNFLRQQSQSDSPEVNPDLTHGNKTATVFNLDQLQEKHDIATRNNHPGWLYKKIAAHWPNQQSQIITYNNSTPPMSIRINPQLISRNDYLTLLTAEGIDCIADDKIETGITLKKAVDVSRLPKFDKGWVSIQDLGAQLAAPLLHLRAGMEVLDACAAPGGKTTHILEAERNISLTAIDSQAERLSKVSDNLQRCGYKAELICADAAEVSTWWNGKPFDRILLDAPCSGTGVISHHPDIKLLRRAADINTFAKQQMRLLQNLWPLLKEQGELLYCTCSIMPEENHLLIKQFLDDTPNAKLSPLISPQISSQQIEAAHDCSTGHQLLPNSGKNGGFFYARLSKIAKL